MLMTLCVCEFLLSVDISEKDLYNGNMLRNAIKQFLCASIGYLNTAFSTKCPKTTSNMAEKLNTYFDYVQQSSGVSLRMKVADLNVL